jgi:hypothetical protein
MLQLGFDRGKIGPLNGPQLLKCFTLRRISVIPPRFYRARALRFDNRLASILSPSDERRKLGERTILALRRDA